MDIHERNLPLLPLNFCLRIKRNKGAHGRKSFLESLNVKCGPNVIAGHRKENSLRLSNTWCNITEKYKKQVFPQL